MEENKRRSQEGASPDTGVQSINRAFQILEALGEHRGGLSIAELVESLHLNKSTIHRILQTLAAWGYVAKDERSKCYRLGMKVMALSSHYLGSLELKTEALPFMERLQQQTELFVHLGMLDGRDVVYLEKIGPYTHFRMYSQIGRRAALYATGLGKAIFAQLDKARQAEILKELSFEPITEHTVRDEESFLQEIARTEARGYALDEEENEIGMRCVAAPVFDYTGRVIGAVSTSGYVTSFPREKIEQFGAYVMDCARNISLQMGYQEPGK
ncbi:MAG: IclR family transcriptional regulator [Clostridia bacterium]|nr:IclR family transcriptional regulator [Clostridia bacterium]